ncbi:MAG: nucleoside 2-deoxyribosyltransferase [Candidatus Dependentiae bacterium]|nr:nucleoside 2-deoxyribosyltransferase [Candidatus Dependentiae bacterium]
MSYAVFFSGALFNHRDLAGNELLAKALAVVSQDRYRPVLPQRWFADGELCTRTRNKDIRGELEADIVLFNFDGTELDSGTVVEYMIAKMLDMPAVALRTDVRRSGDCSGLNWNLMVSGYPRTRVIEPQSSVWYRDYGLDEMYRRLASVLAESLDSVMQEKGCLHSRQEVRNAYLNVVRALGAGFAEELTEAEIEKLVDQKMSRGLY